MTPLYKEMSAYIDAGAKGIEALPDGRKSDLGRIADFVEGRLGEGKPALITFICTHNSRRSHRAQIWAQTAAIRCGLAGVQTFSGGIEETSFNRSAAAALSRAGFRIDKTGDGDNPVYSVRPSDDLPAMEIFSKKYNTPSNPPDDFCAVLTCSDADARCPAVPGSALRIVLPYEDPKVYDGTGREELEYDERCRQISSEMLYLFSHVKSG